MRLHLTVALVVAASSPLAAQRAAAPCTKAVAACERWITFGSGPSRSLIYATHPLGVRNAGITRALVMVHGAGRNADHYFETSTGAGFLAGALDNTIIIAPRFAAAKDKVAPNELLWPEGGNSWRGGGTSPSNNAITAFDFVGPGYFAMLRTPVLEGHTFPRADTPRDSIVIDDRVARQAFGDAPAVGRRLIVGVDRQTFTVIGVVKHQRRRSMTGDEAGTIYIAQEALNQAGGRWAIRVDGDTTGLAAKIRATLATVKSDYASNSRAAGPGSTRLIVNDIEPLSHFVDRAMAPTRFALVLITIFAVVAALLTAIGLYGVVATMARQRTSEIGIRLAFGAEARDIFRLIVGHGLRLSSIGLVLGLGIALAATKALSGLLVAVQPRDPATFLVMAGVFLAIALAACWIPARRAAALDPSVALRDDH